MGRAVAARAWQYPTPVVAACVSVTLVAAGGTALAGSAARGPAPAGTVAPASAVPWKQVGSGWVLAEYWPGKFGFEGGGTAAVTKLYLVDPAGGKYLMHTWKA